ARLDELPALAVGFKRAIYETLARDFARFAAP
ncbi:MAG: RNA pyrophosphohydrolase, partial [Paracraurococcus sp.]